MTFAGQGNFKRLWMQNIPLVPLYFLASAAGAAVILLFQHVAGPWAFLLAIPILLVVYYAHLFYNEKFEEVRGLYKQTVQAFAEAIDALEMHTDSKGNTKKHVLRTQTATLKLARSLGVDERTFEALEIASTLHDVGKISIPTYILQKPTRLTELEFQKMSTHPEVGAQILSSINFPGPVIEIVRHHHENWDGSGYPDGLKGEDIPLGARILSVADFFEALRSPRVYRKRSHDREAALSIMSKNAYRFDPRVFSKFVEIVPQIDEALERLEIPPRRVEVKEHRDRMRLPDIVGVPNSPTLGKSVSEPQREVFTLFEILQTIGSSLSRTDTLTIIASKIEKIVPFDTLVIYLVDEPGAVLSPAYAAGRDKELFKKLSIEVGTRLAGWVTANNRMLYNVHPGPDVMALPDDVRSQYENAILAPLAHEERPLGAIALYSGNNMRYLDDHIRLLEIVANRASIALYNAIRFEETQEDAFTDRLTGLANSRFLYIFFEQTLSEAKRYREPLTVIEMDLDDFKSINDRYGHHSGDRFLKEVGRILKGQMRESDVLVRYAGDEFIAVLPKTATEQARLFSYRLQDAVEAAEIDVGIGRMLQVGISLGLASFPTDGTDLESLLMAADKNMYVHKSRRKGRRRKPGEFEPSAHQPSLFGTDESSGPHAGVGKP
jgi:diguanylate cyclase (GGDEF)-like protein/putative nucleotidyltransferase with HDIG domain